MISYIVLLVTISASITTHVERIVVSAQQTTNGNSKRGLAFVPPSQQDDFALFFSEESMVRWYHNWTPNPSRIPTSSKHPVEFIPMIHGTSNLEADIAAISRLQPNVQFPEDGRRRLLTFNEPDGSIDSGGSDISPRDAASAYLASIVPLRNPPHNMLISHPSVTGSGSGLNWLREFNQSCYELNATQGCPTDFVAVHFYGDFTSMASWLDQVNAFYNSDTVANLNSSSSLPSQQNGLPLIVTEFALPQSSAIAAEGMLNQSLPYLDNLSYVDRYAWFGLFRANEANEWTGGGNAMLDNNGSLTALGSEYLGGSARGFTAGAKGSVSMFGAGWDWTTSYGDGRGGGRGGGFDVADSGIWSRNALLKEAWKLVVLTAPFIWFLRY